MNEERRGQLPSIIPNEEITEPVIQAPLMEVLGIALERITRERSGIDEEIGLPERAVYLLDPNKRRLLMVSQRQQVGKASVSAGTSGLFAEIVELDEEDQPLFRLTGSDKLGELMESFQVQGIPPNKYQLPPSLIEIAKDSGEEITVPLNKWLANLNLWLSETSVEEVPRVDDPEAQAKALADFMERFQNQREEIISQGQRKIKEIFPDSEQGISDKVTPVHVIFTKAEDKTPFIEASLAAGFYPVFPDVDILLNTYSEAWLKRFVKREITREGFFMQTHAQELLKISLGVDFSHFIPALYTVDRYSLIKMFTIGTRKDEENIFLERLIKKWRKEMPLFAVIEFGSPAENPTSYKTEDINEGPQYEPYKDAHGLYGLTNYDPERYQGLLLKLKADLMLTLSLRGSAPIVK